MSDPPKQQAPSKMLDPLRQQDLSEKQDSSKKLDQKSDPFKQLEPSKKSDPHNKRNPPKMAVDTILFNPSVCTCGEHGCKPHYRMERKVRWINEKANTATKAHKGEVMMKDQEVKYDGKVDGDKDDGRISSAENRDEWNGEVHGEEIDGKCDGKGEMDEGNGKCDDRVKSDEGNDKCDRRSESDEGDCKCNRRGESDEGDGKHDCKNVSGEGDGKCDREDASDEGDDKCDGKDGSDEGDDKCDGKDESDEGDGKHDCKDDSDEADGRIICGDEVLGRSDCRAVCEKVHGKCNDKVKCNSRDYRDVSDGRYDKNIGGDERDGRCDDTFHGGVDNDKYKDRDDSDGTIVRIYGRSGVCEDDGNCDGKVNSKRDTCDCRFDSGIGKGICNSTVNSDENDGRCKRRIDDGGGFGRCNGMVGVHYDDMRNINCFVDPGYVGGCDVRLSIDEIDGASHGRNGSRSSDDIDSVTSDHQMFGSNGVLEEYTEEIGSAFGIMSVYCNSELHNWRKVQDEADGE